MAYRLKHRPEIVWLSTPLTIVTKWKSGFGGKMIPTELATGHPGMALVIMNLPDGRQQFHFATREEVELHFEEEVAAPEHTQSETGHYTYVTPWWLSPYSPQTATTYTNKTATNTNNVGSFWLEPPDAGKAL